MWRKVSGKRAQERNEPWADIYLGRRAGLTADSPEFTSLLLGISAAETVSIYGFYCHAGQAYASTSLPEASSFLSVEVQAVNAAAKLAQNLLPSSVSEQFVLSVGSTPTAHAFSEPSDEVLAELKAELHGKLELHAGNYPVLDLQQLHTNLITSQRVAHRVLASVISYYPGRSAHGGDEALCDAGAIAMSKDTGPSGGFGDVVGNIGKGWRLGRVSQVSLKMKKIPDQSGPI